MNIGKNKNTHNLSDFIASGVLLVLSILVFIYGIYIVKTMQLGKGVDWYVSPALMPLFIGFVLFILSLLQINKYRSGISEYIYQKKNGFREHKNDNIKTQLFSYRNNQIVRLVITLILLVLYVFVLIGRVHFMVATFIYLFMNMWIFRDNNFAIWKIITISATTSFLIYLGFGVVAKIPLP